MASVDETCRVEQHKIKMFQRLGYGQYASVQATELGTDYHEVEALLKKGCSSTLALKIARP